MRSFRRFACSLFYSLLLSPCRINGLLNMLLVLDDNVVLPPVSRFLQGSRMMFRVSPLWRNNRSMSAPDCCVWSLRGQCQCRLYCKSISRFSCCTPFDYGFPYPFDFRVQLVNVEWFRMVFVYDLNTSVYEFSAFAVG